VFENFKEWIKRDHEVVRGINKHNLIKNRKTWIKKAKKMGSKDTENDKYI
jgi:hypothetical protein